MLIDSNFEESGSSADILKNLFAALITLLHDERETLIQHDGARLEMLSAQKLQLCNQISQELKQDPALGKKIAQAAAPTAATDTQFDPRHVLLAQLATRARDYNLVNGKILHRSQQSIREILGIISGQSIDGLYGQSGQQDAKANSSSGAFIRA